MRRAGYLLLGWFSLAAGIVGMAIPVWPTTCFLLLSAWSFGRSSKRMEHWLHTNRLFGEYLRRYRTEGIIPSPVKWGSISILWMGIGGSMLVPGMPNWVRWMLLGVAMVISAHLILIPTGTATVPKPSAEGHTSG